MPAKTKKATVNLHPEVLDALDEAMSHGAASSKNALVEQALIKELKELKKRERQAQWNKATKDPLLLKDIEKVGDDFKYADAETSGRVG